MKLKILACSALLQLPLAADGMFIDVAQLEGKYLFTKGELSLAIKPGGGGDVYLVNDTDQPVPGAAWELANCVLEAKIGGAWKRCEPIELGCGTTDGSRPLPPRKAYLLPSQSGMSGDQEAEMRYSVFEGGLVSASFRGRYSSRARATAAYQEALLKQSWEKLPYANGPEEYVALLELQRHCEGFRMSPEALKGLAQHMSPIENDKARFQSAAAKMFARPQPQNLGAAAFFERCVTALSTPPSQKHAYGSPERCRAMVWRRLSYPPDAFPFVSEASKEEAKAILASGNPWGVDKERVMVLMGLTIKALSSSDAHEKQEAGAFLGMSWIREEHFPKGAIDKLLESKAAEIRKAAAAIRERATKVDPKP